MRRKETGCAYTVMAIAVSPWGMPYDNMVAEWLQAVRENERVQRNNVHFFAVGKLSFDFVVHDQQVPLAGGIHAKDVMAAAVAAAASAHLSFASSSAQKVFMTLPACAVLSDGSNTPSHCRNSTAASGEAWGKALRMAMRTASFNASPLGGMVGREESVSGTSHKKGRSQRFTCTGEL
jgi:hypothetical protein